MSGYEIFKEVIEIIYMLSGVGVIIGLFLAYNQLKQMKTDYETSNDRASIEKSMEYLHLFATTIIPVSSEYFSKMTQSKLQKYKGPMNKDFRFDEHCRFEAKYIQEHLRASSENKGVHILNQLEYFSASMISGLADEKLAFTSLGETYCKTVEELYVMLCYTRRKQGSELYSNTIKLYDMWKSRIEKLYLEKDREKLDKQLSTIDSQTIPKLHQRKEGQKV